MLKMIFQTFLKTRKRLFNLVPTPKKGNLVSLLPKDSKMCEWLSYSSIFNVFLKITLLLPIIVVVILVILGSII